MSSATSQKPARIIVDPAVWEAEQNFQKMMARFRARTLEQHIRWEIEHGFMNPDGSVKLPEGDPCVTRVDTQFPPAKPAHETNPVLARQHGVLEGMKAALILQLRKKFETIEQETLDRIDAANGYAVQYWLERILAVDTLAAVFPFELGSADPSAE